jgi:magnesium chelatase family protein
MNSPHLMGYAQVFSRALIGLEAPEVRVEVHISNGLPACNLVGLPEAEVRESRDRVRSAIQHAGFDFPNRRITINLAPADLPKHSGRFDLPIAIGLLVASGQISNPRITTLLEQYDFVGELSLSGKIKPIVGGLALALAHQRAATSGTPRVLVMPQEHRVEMRAVASLAKADFEKHVGELQPTMALASQLEEVANFLNGIGDLESLGSLCIEQRTARQFPFDISEVRGQQGAKRALEIAAAGQHSLMLIGSPGVGKSMLAQRLPTLLPDADAHEVLAQAAMMSLRGLLDPIKLASSLGEPAFRSPHHSASVAAIVGGGNPPRPGEISLAHGGILFLDELAEFNRGVLEALREPLEAHKVLISRSTRHSEFPARFQLVAAMNPCPCGYLGHSSNRCRCSADKIQSYQSRVSGPLLDRIDLHVTVPSINEADMLANSTATTESSQVVAARVCLARVRQLARQQKTNALLSPAEIHEYCELSSSVSQFTQMALARLNWSGRSIHRVLKVARTIADLSGVHAIEREHIAEAIQWRRALTPNASHS